MNPSFLTKSPFLFVIGTDVARQWEPDDSKDRRLPGDIILEFSRLAERWKEIPINRAIPRIFTPGCIFQTKMGLDIYITDEHDAKYCDPPDPVDVNYLVNGVLIYP